MPESEGNTMPEKQLPTRPPSFPDQEPFHFYRKETKEHEEVHLTDWVWVVQYLDKKDDVLYQYDFKNREFHQFKEIQTDRPFIFKMVHALGKHPQEYSLLFDPSCMKLIHFYRNGMLKNLTEFPRLHVFGYEKKVTIEGKSATVKFFNVITPDGNLVTTDNMDYIHF